MVEFQIGTCDLTVRKDALEQFSKENYMRFYKKDKLRHITRNDKRLPKLKITDDIFSLQIWFKDKGKNEHGWFIDGSVSMDVLTIHTITTNKDVLNEYELAIFSEILKGLSRISEGYVLISVDSKPKRIHNGHMDNYDTLLSEMFSHLPKEKQSEVEDVYQWLLKQNKTD